MSQHGNKAMIISAAFCRAHQLDSDAEQELGAAIDQALTAPGKHRFPIADYKPCEKCGGVAVAEIDIGRSGYSCGSGFNHTADCPATMCPHGVKWFNWATCVLCQADDERRAREANDE